MHFPKRLHHGLVGPGFIICLLCALLLQLGQGYASELQIFVTENFSTCTCLINGDKKMPKASGLHFLVGLGK